MIGTAELRHEIEQRTRAEEALRKSEKEQAVTAERNRLARELHDAVTQTLFSSSLIAEVLPRLWQRNREEALARLHELVARAAVVRLARKPTLPTRSSRKKRLESKARRAQVKKLRGRIRAVD